MCKGTILVIDDEQDVRDILQYHLGKQNYRVLAAENGEEAMGILRREDNRVHVGLIFCDIRMPKVNGIECIDFLKKEAPDIPVVVLTGYPDMEMEVAMMKKGVKEYLVKPIERKELIQKTEALVAAGKEMGYQRGL